MNQATKDPLLSHKFIDKTRTTWNSNRSDKKGRDMRVHNTRVTVLRQYIETTVIGLNLMAMALKKQCLHVKIEG